NHAFLYSSDTMTDLGTLGGNSSIGNGINDSGQVVGQSVLPGGTAVHAFLWSAGTMTDLGTLGGLVSQASGINTSSQVVGFSELEPGSSLRHAFVWRGGVMRDLNDLVPTGSGWILTVANGINDAGQIVGTGIGPDSLFHGFLLTPNPAASFYSLTPCR